MNSEDLQLEFRWGQLLNKIHQALGVRPKDLHGVLFLIGVQELGKGYQPFSKEEKQDLMHIAICRLLSRLGFYELEGIDKDGWPHWRLLKPLPQFDLAEQEKLLKMQAIAYFEEEKIFA